MFDDKVRSSMSTAREPAAPVLPVSELKAERAQAESVALQLHPAIYIAGWIAMSSGVIIFNKWILDTAKFHFPIFLTTWHMVVATCITQFLARFTTLLDSRKNVPMTGAVYLRAIVPIGAFFSLSLICGNQAYLYLSVSFIQMLKATIPVVLLLMTWIMGLAPPSLKTLGNVSFIVIGVTIASIGEIKFVLAGFVFQCGGIVTEAIRLAMIQRILSSADFKMDPIVSLYYYAPACAFINAIVGFFSEFQTITMSDTYRVGVGILIANAAVAFLLNVSVVLLIGRTSSLVLTLSGVLKDILLVFASMFIFGDPVTLLQAFGYGIALAGLVYYRIGGEKLREYAASGGRTWADFGSNRPMAQKLVPIGLILVFGILVTANLMQGTRAPRS